MCERSEGLNVAKGGWRAAFEAITLTSPIPVSQQSATLSSFSPYTCRRWRGCFDAHGPGGGERLLKPVTTRLIPNFPHCFPRRQAYFRIFLKTYRELIFIHFTQFFWITSIVVRSVLLLRLTWSYREFLGCWKGYFGVSTWTNITHLIDKAINVLKELKVQYQHSELL